MKFPITGVSASEAIERLASFAKAINNRREYVPDPEKIQTIEWITGADKAVIAMIELETIYTFDEAIDLLLKGVQLKDLWN